MKAKLPKGKCGARKRDGQPCQSYAMDNGRCRMHGGASTGTGRLIHGRYSLRNAEALSAKIDQYRDDSRPLDLTDELALSRALLEQMLERITDHVTAKEIEFLRDQVEHIARLAERITKMLNNTALTGAEIQFLQARIVDIVLTYVPSDRRADAAAALARAFGVQSAVNGAALVGAHR